MPAAMTLPDEPCDACPDCGGHSGVTYTDGSVKCQCGWAGAVEDLSYRVSQEQINDALTRGEEAIKMLEDELAKMDREPSA